MTENNLENIETSGSIDDIDNLSKDLSKLKENIEENKKIKDIDNLLQNDKLNEDQKELLEGLKLKDTLKNLFSEYIDESKISEMKITKAFELYEGVKKLKQSNKKLLKFLLFGGTYEKENGTTIAIDNLPWNEVKDMLTEIAELNSQAELKEAKAKLQTNDELQQLEINFTSDKIKDQINSLKTEIEKKNLDNALTYKSSDLLKNTKLYNNIENADNNPEDISTKEMLESMDQAWFDLFSRVYDYFAPETIRNMATGFNVGIMNYINTLDKKERQAFMKQISSGLDLSKSGKLFDREGIMNIFNIISNNENGKGFQRAQKIRKFLKGINNAELDLQDQENREKNNSYKYTYLHNPAKFSEMMKDFMNSDEPKPQKITNKIIQNKETKKAELSDQQKKNIKDIANSFSQNTKKEKLVENIQGIASIPNTIQDTIGQLEDDVNQNTNKLVNTVSKIDQTFGLKGDLKESVIKFVKMFGEIINGFAGYQLIDTEQYDIETQNQVNVNEKMSNYLQEIKWEDTFLQTMKEKEENETNTTIDINNLQYSGSLSNQASKYIKQNIENENYDSYENYFESIFQNDSELHKYIQNNPQKIKTSLEDDLGGDNTNLSLYYTNTEDEKSYLSKNYISKAIELHEKKKIRQRQNVENIDYPQNPEYNSDLKDITTYLDNPQITKEILYGLGKIESDWEKSNNVYDKSHPGLFQVGLDAAKDMYNNRSSILKQYGITQNPNNFNSKKEWQDYVKTQEKEKDNPISLYYGSLYLDQKVSEMNGNIKLGLIAYNQGSGSVNKWLDELVNSNSNNINKNNKYSDKAANLIEEKLLDGSFEMTGNNVTNYASAALGKESSKYKDTA